MFRILAAAFLLASIVSSRCADEDWLFSRLSPDLKKFMVGHPAALTVLSNVFSETFSNRSVHVTYFYSTNEAEARAFHFNPGLAGVADVFICVRENQHPLDQFTTLLFESLNFCNDKQFKNLVEEAYNGSVSKDVFVNTITRLEFTAMVKTRSLLVPLQFSKEEIKQSRLYTLQMDCPLDFKDYVAYLKAINSQLAIVKVYEDQYDELRKKNPAAKPKDEPKSEHP
jgi:hypothetical protein